MKLIVQDQAEQSGHSVHSCLLTQHIMKQSAPHEGLVSAVPIGCADRTGVK